MSAARRVYVSAGEPSGDMHAAALVTALGGIGTPLQVDAMGGVALAGAGAQIVESAEHLAAFGLVETLGAIPAHIAALGRARARLRRVPYAAAVLIDYPGFHLRVARLATRCGIPVLYYVPPQLWAWGPGRARRLRETTRVVACVLPFEAPFFGRFGIRATFVGHPVLDHPQPPRDTARRELGIPEGHSVLALLPGSRRPEIDRHWHLFRQTAHALRARIPDLTVVLAVAPGQTYRLDADPLITADAPRALAAADVALCKSGTATLQAAVAGTPMVIAYQLHPLTFAVARRVVRTPFIGLPNLVAGRGIAPEFVQADATPARLAAALELLLDVGGLEAQRQRTDLREVVERLGPPGAAHRVAALVEELAA